MARSGMGRHPPRSILTLALFVPYRPYMHIRRSVPGNDGAARHAPASSSSGSKRSSSVQEWPAGERTASRSPLRRIVKAVLPSRARRFLRAVHRDRVFRRAMTRFLNSPDILRGPNDPVLLDLIYGWGNESWCARGEFLADCINHAATSRGPILECGSGLSTLLIGAIARKRNHKHFALEHQPRWADRVQKYLDRYRLDSVTLFSTPLTDYGGFDWYDTRRTSLPASFDLVLCDGPPGDTRGGRYGLLPVMRGRLTPGCTILLDDAVREEELAIASRWQREMEATVERLGAGKLYMKVTVTGVANPRQRQLA